MAHEIETMAYSGEAPWHKLGTRVLPDTTPDEMLIQAGLNWNINKEGLITADSKQSVPEHYALVRSTDLRVLGHCGKNYKPVQPSEVLKFFHEFVETGGMKMETAGSLSHGKHIFALASIQESFVLANKDKVEGYLLFSSPNVAGKAMRILFTPVRVVCNNTLTMALNTASGSGEFRLHHANSFDPEIAKAALGLAKGQLGEFEKVSEFLAEKTYKDDKVLQGYFREVFPTEAARKGHDEFSITRTAEAAMNIIDRQPGAEYFPNTWWNAFNAVTYIVDHLQGRNDNNRLRNAWFGHGEKVKQRALKLAVENARAAQKGNKL